MSNLWELRIGVWARKWDIKKVTSELKTEFKKAWDNIEKSLWGSSSKWLEKIKKESEKAVKTIWGLNNKLHLLNEKLKGTQIWTVQFAKLQNEIRKTKWQLDKATNSWTKFSRFLWGLKWSLLWAFSVVAVTWFLWSAIKSFATFEQWLARINTVAWVSKKEMKNLWVDIKKVSEIYGKAKEELLETAFNISSAWVEFENIWNMLRLSSAIAVGANTDTTTAFNGIIAVIKKYNLDISEAKNIAEKFFITNKLGQTTIWEVADGVTKLTSTAKIAWITIDELFATYSALTWVTGNATEVTTQLNGAINALASPTKESRKLFDQLWVEVWQTAIKKKWLLAVIKDVYDATGGNTEQLRKLIPEIEATKLVVALATTQYDKFKDASYELEHSQWALKFALAEMSDTTQFKLEVATTKWENFKVRVWQAITPVLWYLSDLAWLFVSTFNILKFAVKGWINVILWIPGIVVATFIDVVQNFKEFARVIPEFVKKAVNNLPWIMSAGIRSMLNLLPWWVGEKIADKLWLDTFWNVFKDVNTNFNFKNFSKIKDHVLKENDELTNWVKEEWENMKDIMSGWIKNKLLEDYENIVIKSSKTTLKSLKETRAELQKQLEEVEVGSDKFKRLQKEIAKTTEEIDKNTKTQITWWGKVTEENKKQIEKRIKDLEKETDANEKNIKKLDDLYKRYSKNVEKYNDNIKNSNRELREDIETLSETYEKNLEKIESKKNINIWDINLSTDQKIAERILQIEKDLKQAEIDKKEELKKGLWYTKEVLETSDLIKSLEEEKLEAQKLVNEEILKTARLYDEASEIQRIQIERVQKLKDIESESKKEKDEVTGKFEKEKEELEHRIKINDYFLNQKNFSEKEFLQIMNNERFLELEKEEQNLIISLWKKRLLLEEEKASAILLQQEISNSTIELSNTTTGILQENINTLSDEYKSLISQIQSAIIAQNRLNALRSSGGSGFAEWGYTGDGGKYEVAWKVHKWEYVIPQSMIKKMPNIHRKSRWDWRFSKYSRNTYNSNRWKLLSSWYSLYFC